MVLWFLLLLFSFGVQSLSSLTALVRDHGPQSLSSHAAFLGSVQVACLLLLALAGSGAHEGQEGDETVWLSSLPAPAWVLHAAKVGETALLNPVGWLLLLPFFNSLGVVVGLGVLTPVIALSTTLPLLLCSALLTSVVDAAPVALLRSGAFRVLRVAGPLLGSLVVLFWLGESTLRMAEVDVWGWLAAVPELAWLPFSEPARAVLSWKTAPLQALAWYGLFAVEMLIGAALAVFALRRIHRADLVLGRDARRGVRGAVSTRARVARRFPVGLLGGVVRQELLWLSRNTAQGLRLVLGIGVFNGIALLLAGRAAGLQSPALPGLALFGVGVLLLVTQAPLLERERPALWHWGTLPRPMSWLLARKTFFMAALALLGAAPAIVYTIHSLSRPLEAIPALLYAGVALVSAAFLQTSLWFDQVRPDAATSQSQHTTRTLKLWFFALWLGVSGFMPFDSRPTSEDLPPLITAAALVWSLWTASLRRAPFVLDSSMPEPRAPSAAYALVTIMLLRDVFAASFAEGLRRGLPPAHVAVLSYAVMILFVLLPSLLWLKLGRDVPELRAQLGLGRGRGSSVLLREGLLWSVPAIAVSVANAFVLARGQATVEVDTSSQDLLAALAHSPGALVGVACITVPIVEELVYRGMLFRSLRASHGLAIGLPISAVLFALQHPFAQLVPTFILAVCAALALERSRSLYAAVLVHVLYNGFTVGLRLIAAP